DTLVFHQARILVRDRSAAATKNGDVIGTLPAELPNDFSKKFDVTAVVTRDANGHDVFLDGGPHDVADIAMESQIHHLDAVPDKVDINRINRAVMPIADRHSGENADRGSRASEQPDVNRL